MTQFYILSVLRGSHENPIPLPLPLPDGITDQLKIIWPACDLEKAKVADKDPCFILCSFINQHILFVGTQFNWCCSVFPQASAK